MNQNTQQLNIKNEILKKIETGEIHMKSKAYFLVKLALLIVVVVLITLISVFLLSFTIFSMSLDGSLFLVRFGGTGLYNFIFTIPWYLFAIDVFLLIVLDILIKSFKFGYKNPIIYLFIGTFFLITLVSTLINLTPFHQNVMVEVQKKKVPFLPSIYSGVKSDVQKPGTYKGFVSSIRGNRFTYTFSAGLNKEKIVAEVVTSVNVEDYLKEGDLVFVAGSLENGEIKAYGIKKLSK